MNSVWAVPKGKSDFEVEFSIFVCFFFLVRIHMIVKQTEKFALIIVDQQKFCWQFHYFRLVSKGSHSNKSSLPILISSFSGISTFSCCCHLLSFWFAKIHFQLFRSADFEWLMLLIFHIYPIRCSTISAQKLITVWPNVPFELR